MLLLGFLGLEVVRAGAGAELLGAARLRRRGRLAELPRPSIAAPRHGGPRRQAQPGTTYGARFDGLDKHGAAALAPQWPRAALGGGSIL